METITITKDVEVSPDKLDSNIKQHITDELRKTIGSCCKKHGYILDIIQIIKIENKKISNTSCNIIFSVKYEIKILKPEINKIIKCNVNMIFTHGIFAGVNEMNILVPSNELSKYRFNSKDNTYYNDRNIIKKDDEIDIVIKNVKYMKKQYSCIGVLKE